jgi:hypothetical protein
MPNFDLLTSTSTLYDHEGNITGFQVQETNLGPIDAILAVVICITVLSVVLFRKF